MAEDLESQARKVIERLKVIASGPQPMNRDSPVFGKCLEWIRIAPGQLDNSVRAELMAGMAAAFAISERDILVALEGGVIEFPRPALAQDEEARLEAQLGKGGWFELYIEYTRYTESPLSYHLVCGLCALGCALGRRCYLDQGHYRLYAPLNAILIGPTGVVHKSSAVDIAKNLIRDATVCPIAADKITAEKLAMSLRDNPQQFVYAPEMSVFFGRQRYNEGLTNLILRLLDYPVEWSVDTITHGEVKLEMPTISILGGSTMGLLNSSSADEVMSGGFLNRFLPVVENTTPRIFRRPRKGDGEVRLIKILEWMKTFSGEIKLVEGSPADQFYDAWYIKRRKRLQLDPSLAEVTQRGADHLLRLAMLIHVVDCNTLIICERCMRMAEVILSHFERSAPQLVKAMNSTTQTNFTDYVIEQLIKLEGAAEHSTLLRKCSSKLNAVQFKGVIQTLNESGRVKITKRGLAAYYILKEDIEHASA